MSLKIGNLSSHVAMAAVTAALSVTLAPAGIALANEATENQVTPQATTQEQTAPQSAETTDVTQAQTTTQELVTGETQKTTAARTEGASTSSAQGTSSSAGASETGDSATQPATSDAQTQTSESSTAPSVPQASTTAGVAQTTATGFDASQDAQRTLAQIAADNKDGKIVSAGTYVIKNRGKALDVYGGSTNNGANVQLWDDNQSGAQKWNVTVDSDGYITLVNLESGKALDVSSGSKTPGANVWQYAANGSDAQRWAAEKVDGGLRLRSALGYDLVLDVWAGSTANGANVQTYTANGTAAQVWEFVRQAIGDLAAKNAGGAILAPGRYVVQSGNSTAVLEVAGGSKADGANVRVWHANGTGAQTWRASVDELGYVTLTNDRSGKALDVTYGRASRGQNVDQYASNGTFAQRWVVEKVGDHIVLHSAINYDRVLDLSGNNTSNGTNVDLWDANGTTAQQWCFWEAYPKVAVTGRSADDGVYVVKSVKSGRVLDVSGGSMYDCASVGTYAANGTGAQAWRLTLGSNGFYTVRNAQSGRCLDVVDRVVIPGASIQQWGLDGQTWNVVADPAHAGSYRLVSSVSGLALVVRDDGSLTTAKLDANDEGQLFSLDVAPAPKVADGWKTVTALGTGKVLDVPGNSTASGTTVQTYASNGSRAQSWWTRRQADGSYTVQASNSGLYLTDANGVRMQKDAGDSSRWTLDWGEKGGYVLRNVASQAKMVVDGVASWLFSAATSGIKAGFYEIASALDGNLRLDVAGGSKGAGANVQSYASNGSLAQRYWIRSAGGDTFTITNCNSDLNLDVTAAGTANGTNLQQYYRNSSAAQRFRFTMGESGLEIRSDLGDVVIDVYGGSTSNGANVDVWSANGTAAQAWVLVEAAAPAKMGWQNPSWMYQVSRYNVPSSPYASGIFRYMSPSRVGIEYTRDQVINAFVSRAYDYLGTPYRWNYACAPGVGVDCVGLVMQCAYACGMNLGLGTGAYDFNPYAHYATGNSGWHSHDANNFWNGGKGIHLGIGARQKGDLISWNGHIAVYIGGDKIIEAPGAGQSVRITSVWRYGTPRGVIRIFS